MADYYVPHVSPRDVRARAARPPDPFADAACPACGAEPGDPCDPDPPLVRGATAHPDRVDAAMRRRLHHRLKGALHG